MDNHPIPQDVTGFQFRLIGEMTIKQFAYLATGVSFGALIYLLPASLFVKLPFVLLFSFVGAGFAFVPISGRPMDVMTFNFLKALFSPTQFFYQKTGGSLFVPTKQVSISPKILQSDNKQITPVPEEKTEDIEEKASSLEKALETTQKEEASLPPKSPSLAATHQKVLDLEKELGEILSQRERLTQELLSLKRNLDLQKTKTFTPSIAQTKPASPAPPIPQTQNVKQVPKNMQTAIGLPMPSDVPNLIGGILKDARGNPLPNILVEIKDAEGNPVRAFKTNGLGQFISATPLLNGTYTVAFEDPKNQNRFDAISITANGQVMLPIEAISVDQREELRRDLFGV